MLHWQKIEGVHIIEDSNSNVDVGEENPISLCEDVSISKDHYPLNEDSTGSRNSSLISSSEGSMAFDTSGPNIQNGTSPEAEPSDVPELIPPKKRKTTKYVGNKTSNIDSAAVVESSDINPQIVRIYRICCQTVRTDCGEIAQDYNEEQLIESIIAKNKGHGRTEEEEYPWTFIKQVPVGFSSPILNENDEDEENERSSDCKFHTEIYVQNVKKNYNLTKSYDINLESNHWNCIIFHYRPGGDIFALTLGSGWTVVQWCSDKDFPGAIAGRLFDKQGEIKSSGSKLIEKKMTSTYRKPVPSADSLELIHMCTNFAANLRKDAPIYKLPCFQNADGIPLKNLQIEIGFGYIRILKEVSKTDFFPILDHLSSIANKKSSYSLNCAEFGETDTKAHIHYLPTVSHPKDQSLDFTLVRKLQNAVYKYEKHELNNFSMGHGIENFNLATEFKLHLKTKLIHYFVTKPTLKEVFERIRALQSRYPFFKNLFEKVNSNTFKGRLDTFNLSFRIGDNPPEYDSVFNFVESDIVHSDGRVYIKSMSRWYSVNDDYFGRVQRLMIDYLEEYFIQQGQEGSLPIAWPSQSEIQRKESEDSNFDVLKYYISKYDSKKDYYIPMSFENSEGDICKLFDLLFCSPDGDIYIYYIQNGFDVNKTREIAAHIERCLVEINSTSGTCLTISSLKDQHQLRNLYDSWLNQYPLRKPLLSYYQFLNAFRYATCIYALADEPEHYVTDHEPPENLQSRSLSKEKSICYQVTSEELFERVRLLNENTQYDLVSMLELQSGSSDSSRITALTDRVMQALKEGKYVDDDRMVTSKLLNCEENQFEFPGLDNLELRKKIFVIVKSFQSQYKSLLHKLELITIWSTMLDNSYKFGICQIKAPDED